MIQPSAEGTATMTSSSPTRLRPPQERWADPRRPRHRPADGRARRDHREHRAALGAGRARASPTAPASGSSPPTRWPSAACCCSAASSATSSAASGRSSSACSASPSPPPSAALRQSFEVLVGARALQGAVRRAARPRRPLAADDHVHRPRRARQGVRHLRRDRRRRRRHRPAARRRADRVPVLALVACTSTSLFAIPAAIGGDRARSRTTRAPQTGRASTCPAS